jgi:hypothetical protein
MYIQIKDIFTQHQFEIWTYTCALDTMIFKDGYYKKNWLFFINQP